MSRVLRFGYMPLLDAAPAIAALEFGFAEEEGLQLDLTRATNWSMLRDLLDVGGVDAAHMLSVVPVARAVGLGGGSQGLDALMVLSMNGQVFGLGSHLPAIPFGDPLRAGRALAELGRGLRIGVPFPFSMQAELLAYWLDGILPPGALEVRTVPPPRMAEALNAGEIDGFCVGEPWGSHAVEEAGAQLVLPGSAIWSQAPEKVLAARSGWADQEPDLAGRLMRALWRAGRWVAKPQNRMALASVLSRPGYLDVPAEMIDRTLARRLLVTAFGVEEHVPQFQTFHGGCATFPWRSQAAWIGMRLAKRFGLDEDMATERARGVFRSDLYREHLAEIGAAIPRASEKVEGALAQDETFPGIGGPVQLARNAFFDGRVFDPLLRV